MRQTFNTLLSSVLIAFSLNAIAQTGTPTQIKYASFVTVSPSGTAYQRDLATDASGNMYGVGYIKGLTTPPVVGTVTTSGDSIYQKNYGGGNSDGYLYKMNADGKSVSWWTFLGGGGMDDIWGVEYAKEGVNEYLYIAGYTNANISIPTTKLISGASYKGGYEGFVAKINALNGQMMWFNWIGSTADDGAFTVKVSDNYIHVGGHASQNFPTSSNAYKKQLINNFNWSHDGFYARYNNSGELNYSTLVGFESSGNDFMVSAPEGKKGVIGLEVISDYEVYLCGTTKIDGNNAFIKESSPLLPIDGVKATSTYNGFVMRLNVVTSISPFASLIRGTSSSTLTNAVDIKKFGTYLYVLGLAKGGVVGGLSSTTFQKINNGGTDAYVLKIDVSNYTLNNGSMYGGSYDEYVGNLNVCSGEPIFSGQTSSSNLPVVDYLTTGALSSPTRNMDTYKGSSDYFFASLKSDFSSLTFATYLGGSSLEHSYNSDITGNNGGQALIGNDILFAASTHSKSDLPTTIGSWKHLTDATVVNSSGDLDFIVRFEKQGASCAVLNNEAPTLDLDANNSTASGIDYSNTYTENSSSVQIVDVDINILDSDNTNLASAKISLTNWFSGDTIQVVGSLPSGIVAVNTTAGNTRAITLTGSASLANYQTALQLIKYSNSSDNPSSTDRIINITVNDGLIESNVAVARIKITAINDAPSLDLDANNSTASGTSSMKTYVEQTSGVQVSDVDVSALDVDNSSLASATITLTNWFSGDTIKLVGSLPVGISAIVTKTALTRTIALTGAATKSNYQTALSLIQFSSSSKNPVLADRIVDFTISDGFINSNVAVSTIKFTAINDAPTLDLDVNNSTSSGTGYLNTYTENSVGMSVNLADVDVSVIDVDNANLTSATITLTNWFSGDTIQVMGSLPSGITATISKTASTRTITLTGSALRSNYQTAISLVQFSNLSENPDTTGRKINFTVNDGIVSSNIAVATIKVVSVNDAPVVRNEFVQTNEGIQIVNSLSTITSNDFDPENDVLTVTSIIQNTTMGNMEITGSSYVYTPKPFYNGEDTAVFNTCDSKGACNLDTLFITIIPVNSALIIDLDSNSDGFNNDNQIIFTVGGANVNISANQNSIFNPDNIDILSAEFVIENKKNGDTLLINGTLPFGITSSIFSSRGTLILKIMGNSDSTTYKSILKQVQFKNNRNNVDLSDRNIIVSVSNANGNSNFANATIKIINLIDNDTITIPNSQFKTALLNKGFDLNNDGKIQRKEIINIHKLNVSNNGISDLAGIEAFVNLDTLIISHNALNSLNVSALVNLKCLNASYNQLSGLNEQNFANQRVAAISNNTKLQTLLINNNQMMSLDVSNLTSLKYLNATVNTPLSVICVSDQQDLTFFTADVNVAYSSSCGLITNSTDDVKSTEKVLIKVYNLFGEEVHSENNSGFFIYKYSDGSTEKIMK